MGKRRDRRLNTGRRVKVDLYVEPSGDLDESDIAHVDAKHHVSELTQTQSSIGNKSENPLLLLEQYVDDELDEDPKKKSRSCSVESVSGDGNKKVEELLPQTCNVVVTLNGVEEEDAKADIECHKAEALNQNPNNFCVGEEKESIRCFVAAPMELLNTIDTEPVSSEYDVQFPGEGHRDWKMVFHEVSNQYYYWNVDTGETSWHTPDSISLFSTSQTHPVLSGGKSASGATKPPPFVGTCIYPSEPATIGVPTDLCSIQEQVNECESDFRIHGMNEGLDKALIISTEEQNIVEDESNEEDHKVERREFDEEKADGDVENNNDIPFSLLNHGMTLLEKFKSLEGLEEDNGEHGSVSKYCMEIEMRLSDIKELASHALSLLSYWDHLQRRFKHLENMINDIYANFPKPTAKTGYLVDLGLFIEENSTIEHVPGSVETSDGHSNHLDIPTDESSLPPCPKQGSMFGNFTNDTENAWNYENGHCSSPLIEEGELLSRVVKNTEADMVVDMEIEEEPSLVMEHSSRDGTAFAVALSSGEEWAPPLPSESELIPPPPTDEPPEPFFHPPTVSYSPEIPPQFFPDPLGYSSLKPQLEIYEHMVSNKDPLCFNNLYAEVTPVPCTAISSPDFHSGDGDRPPISVSTVTSESRALSFSNYRSVSSLQGMSDGVPTVVDFAIEIPVVPTSAAPNPEKIFGPEASTSTTFAKPHVKVRTVKRGIVSAPTLRSNKKVFSMVDKWKAAKEELYEDIEDEPESAYEALEKKKQKEIQEWRTQHIASGDAKENANFQPLGSDWREQVRKRRKKTTSNDEKCPDLVEISQHLPPGWQAYWDESSKRVYYGNLLTSHTVWDVPSK